jgi:hypothetical protein
MVATVRILIVGKCAMKQFMDVTAVRISALIQYACASVDLEVVSLPGGSLIAVLLCLYAVALASMDFQGNVGAGGIGVKTNR